MINTFKRVRVESHWWVWIIVAAVLLGAALFGLHPSMLWLLAPLAGLGLVVLLRWPILGFPVLVVAALFIPIQIGTGTEVSLNLSALLVPAIFVFWLLTRMNQHAVRFVPSRTTLPLALFLIAGLLSLLIGSLIWDPAVPRSDYFFLVQLAQWAIFAFSAVIFWMAGNLIKRESDLKKLTFFFLAIAGAVALLRLLPPVWNILEPLTTFALLRAPFWICLGALAGGQLLFNRDLSRRWRIFLIAACAGVISYAFVGQAERTSNWVSVGVIIYMLLWLRFPRFRIGLLALAVLGATVFYPLIYQFAGGDAKWDESGASRLVLINRVIELTMRNPITGLGPAAYRPYGMITPLQYDRAYWLEPRINSHNNYVDLFSHTGLLGLGLYLWFVVALGRVGYRLKGIYRTGFAAGYVNAMIAALVSISVAMLLLDWFLPFVYNVGFVGFQASVLLWMFLGGLVVLEGLARSDSSAEVEHAA